MKTSWFASVNLASIRKCVLKITNRANDSQDFSGRDHGAKTKRWWVWHCRYNTFVFRQVCNPCDPVGRFLGDGLQSRHSGQGLCRI